MVRIEESQYCNHIVYILGVILNVLELRETRLFYYTIVILMLY